MPLGMKVILGPGHIVLDGDPAPAKRHKSPRPIFGPCLLWPNGRPSQLLLSSCYTFFHPTFLANLIKHIGWVIHNVRHLASWYLVEWSHWLKARFSQSINFVTSTYFRRGDTSKCRSCAEDHHFTLIEACIKRNYRCNKRKDNVVKFDKKLIRRWDNECELFYYDIFNHFYAVRPGSYRIRWNNAK